MLAISVASIAASLLLGGVLWFGARVPGYSHVRQTISELGEVGSRYSVVVSWGLFAPVGILLSLLTVTLVYRDSSDFRNAVMFLTSAVSIGYLGAAIFPCDPGSPLTGTWRQQIHNLLGGVEYVGGTGALFLAAQSLSPVFDATLIPSVVNGSAVVVGTVTLGLSFSATFAVRGCLQRVGEFALFGNIILLTVILRQLQ